MNKTLGCLIELCEDGPLLVHGPAELDGEPVKAGAAFCRCGHSQNKPYCDGSHKGAEFSDPGSLGTSTVTGAPEGSAPLRIKLAPNGPILCAGALTVRSSDGTANVSGARAALCRCGHSQNKPYCDGTHGKIGFDAG
jgi:CDGSH-type Zn-finger protein